MNKYIFLITSIKSLDECSKIAWGTCKMCSPPTPLKLYLTLN